MASKEKSESSKTEAKDRADVVVERMKKQRSERDDLDENGVKKENS